MKTHFFTVLFLPFFHQIGHERAAELYEFCTVCFAKNLRKCFKVALNNPVMYFITRDEFNKLLVFWMEFGVLPFGRSDRPVSYSRPNSASNARILNLEKKKSMGKTERTLSRGVLPYISHIGICRPIG